MSTPFKPLSEQITNKMIADLKAGTSIFQRPNNSLNSALPFNLESGHRYAGPSALILLMQKRDDPRWGTSNQANRNHTAVVKGATGTLIQFMSNYEYQKMVDAAGEPVLKENGKQRTERIRLEEPKQVDAWLFNGEQLRNIQKWEKEPNILSPAERAQLILDNSKAVIEHGGDDMFYDRQLDAIIIPEQEQFPSPEQYYAEALHQLAHRVNAREALDRPQLGNDPGGMISEELRTNLASLFLSKELNLPYDLNDHVGYVQSWSLMLKQDPSELFKAASDAQQIVDKVLGYEQQIEEKQEAEQGEQADNAMDTAAEIDQPKIDPTKLNEGEVIPHNGTEFKVIKVQKNNVYQMQDLGSEQKFKMSAKDGLFKELLDARNNSQEMGLDRGASAEEAAYHETEAVEQYLDEQFQIER
ncbi:Antirestriction protein ArdC [Mucilaginibacter pineti]|uniref:Antirestriction protein ArdC n=1 Tax=Mucilaginibacter pineti TaxID=1391627 RepID=A0A1G7EFB4_9SPHI|nr:zincin-like metallopeptidase domain-containing protein [Mucilaginibacter pineti]SDE62333.1 Antirestriction protein ArdC [Mucilaginibacter pineti]